MIAIKIIIIFFSSLIIENLIKKYILYEKKMNSINKSNDKNYIPSNEYYIYNWISFNITHLNYSFSFVFNIIKIEYYIGFYDNNNNLIAPSDLSLYHNFHVVCHFEKKKNYVKVDSLANIYKNKYFYCIEFFNFNEEINLGIKLYQSKNDKNTNFYNINFIMRIEINYNHLKYQNNDLFNPLLIYNDYTSLCQRIADKSMKKALKLKKSYIEYPFCLIKSIFPLKSNQWFFINIYDYYFCLCKGSNCLNSTIPDKCKYNFYLHIIDNNRDLYQKTDFLFFDFIFSDLSSDDVYPVFKEMEKSRYPVHYITEDKNIYNEYCHEKEICLTVLPIKNTIKPINGDFLEIYLTLFLKLKFVISGRGTTFDTNLFYNIEYITYICIGHGVCFFKYYLYFGNRIYGIKKNDKLVLPPSNKIINVAKKYGWIDENIIKINLPRWNKYNKIDNNQVKNGQINNNSIFVMFTWRKIMKNKRISSYYLNNINNLVTNINLYKELNKNNVTLYLSFHRLINKKYKMKYKILSNNSKYIKYINQNEISECLSKTSLIVTDFSSIVFDIIYRRKPFIIYIPDSDDPNIKNIYSRDYYELIESMNNGTIYFENKYFNVSKTIKKIIYYINSNFTIEPYLERFYDSFGFKRRNDINTFIDYLKKFS